MGDRSLGKRYPLLLYQRAASHYRRPAFLLSILLLGLWLLVYLNMVEWPQAAHAPWLLAGGSVALLYWLLTLLGPRFAFVQPRQNHLRLRTPVYRLQISYRRLVSTRPINLKKTFPPSGLSQSQRNLLAPFMNQPALGVDLKAYPMKRWVMRLFFNRFFFTPEGPGLILIVDDWMKLSEQISDRIEGWRGDDEAKSRASTYSDAARILAVDSDEN